MRFFLVSVLTLLLAVPVLAADMADITTSNELADAIAQAQPGDTLTLGQDLLWPRDEPLSLPSGVTLQGNGNSLTVTSGVPLLQQDGATGVLLKNVTLRTLNYSNWTIQVRNGDLRLEDCTIQCRVIAWAGGSVVIENGAFNLRFPAGNDNNEAIGVYGGGAFLVMNHCFVEQIAYDVQHVGGAFFHNFGGDPASRLTITNCTIIGGEDPNYDDSGRHLSIFKSDNSAGSDYLTEVRNSIFFAEVESIFHSEGEGRVVSSHNNNAGMFRNPGILSGGNPLHVDFYKRDEDDREVEDKTGDIEEPNPFADVTRADYRLVATSDSATAASDGGPVGALGVVPRVENAYNLDLRDYEIAWHRSGEFAEALFAGWPVTRTSDQQHVLPVPDDFGWTTLRMRAFRTGEADTQTAFQTFVTVPGYEYTISAWSRRGTTDLIGNWEENGSRAVAVLEVADGMGLDAPTLTHEEITGEEGSWIQREVTVTAPSNHLTIRLIHQPNGSWNWVDWNNLHITARAMPGMDVAEGMPGQPVLGYINTIPSETPEERAERHRKVAERRAGIPLIVHRGATKKATENTLEAYSIAMDRGADGIEFDPRLTADGVMVTFHDGDVDRVLNGHGGVSGMSYYQLASMDFKEKKGPVNDKSRVPTIVSLFQLARERAMLLHFDLKQNAQEDLLIGLLDEMDMWDHVVHVNPTHASMRIINHPKARLLEYKQHKPDDEKSEAFQNFLKGPGDMVFTTGDPKAEAEVMGKDIPGEQPLPEGLRAWWWPDGKHIPVE